MKYKYLWFIVLLYFCVDSCKKDAAAPLASSISIIGKWYESYHRSVIYYQNVAIDSIVQTKFTTDDYFEYNQDGSGFISASALPSPRINLFQYTLKGTRLVQYNSVADTGFVESVKMLSAHALSIHFEFQITDSNTGNIDNEIDDLSFTR